MFNFECLTSFTKINLNDVKPVIAVSASAQGITRSMRLVHDRLCPRCSGRAKSVFNFECLTSFTKINLNAVKPVIAASAAAQEINQSMRLVHDSLCPRCSGRAKPVFNLECLTSFTKINLNAVKRVMVHTRD